MSFKALLVSTIFAASAVAQYGGGSSGGSSYGSGGSWGSGSSDSGSNGWSSWSSSQGAPALAAAATSCPAGCMPMPTGPPPPMQTQPGQLIVQVVSVSDANGSLKYFPDKVTAPVGSIVQFQYHPKNHTITESSFAAPCKPLAANLTSPTRPGLKSGFVPVTGMEPFTPVYNVLINDTKPIWIYCGQLNHCQKGMAMVINQNDTSPNTIDAYIANAMKLPLASAPAAPSMTAAPPAASSPPPFGAGGSSSFAPPPAVATVTSTPVGVAPATFTGAAVHASVPQLSTGVAGVVLGALLALW